tara:strand:+ start:265 stop:627 length:363 start_codon:yes stop_codon:yes gene_type:complete
MPQKKKDKGNPYPTMGDGGEIEYLDNVEQWKKDNPLAARKLEAQQKRNAEKLKERDSKNDYVPEYVPGKYKPHPEGEMVAKGGMIRGKKKRNANIDYRKSGMFYVGGMSAKTTPINKGKK